MWNAARVGFVFLFFFYFNSLLLTDVEFQCTNNQKILPTVANLIRYTISGETQTFPNRVQGEAESSFYRRVFSFMCPDLYNSVCSSIGWVVFSPVHGGGAGQKGCFTEKKNQIECFSGKRSSIERWVHLDLEAGFMTSLLQIVALVQCKRST